MATRIAYAFILLINSILSWIMLTPWAIKKLEHLTLDYMTFDCGESGQCYGYFAVQRINFALAIFHFVLAFMLLGVQSTKDGRSALQNGFWGPKIIAWLALVVVSFLIPEGFFLVWGNYFAFVGAMLFVLLGLILLVDLAHTWAEMCLAHIEQDENTRLWRGLLIGSTLSMYGASVAMTVVMYIYFAASGCSMNISAITANMILFFIISIISVQPAIQEANPKAGLAQAAMVTVYCTYLTLSAVAMEPDDKHCNPLIRARGARTTTVVLGAIVTMLTIAYTTTRAATQGFAMGTNRGNSYSQLAADDHEHSLITQQPSSHRQMRAEALQAAVASGALPASALDEDDSDDEDDVKAGKDDERNGTQYNYSLFHMIFLMATCWVATLLTQGISPESASSDFAPIGRTYWASWIKIVSAWLCYTIYAWTIVAPSVLSDREF
jgi:hypothetical protein